MKVYKPLALGFTWIPAGQERKEELQFLWAPLVAQSVCQCRKCGRQGFSSWFGKIPWRRTWQPTPVFLPAKSHGQRKLAGHGPWDHKRAGHNLATKPTNRWFLYHHLRTRWQDNRLISLNSHHSPERQTLLFLLHKIQSIYLWVTSLAKNPNPCLFSDHLLFYRAPQYLMAQVVKNLPAMQETWVRSLGQEDPLEKGMATHPSVKSWLIGKDPDTGKDWEQEEKQVTEDEMVGWHHWLNAHEFEQALGDSEEQGSLACCSPWGRTELNMTGWLTLSLQNKIKIKKKRNYS